MDKKTFNKKASRKTRRKTAAIPQSPVNTMVYKTSWTSGAMTSGTTGAISYISSPSIVNTSEYSVIQALFTEVRLISFKVMLTPTQPVNGSVNHSRLVMGTNMLMNQSVNTAPTSFSSVENTTHVRFVMTAQVRQQMYDMVVPKGLEYANIVGDAPSPVTPWAGSPGLMVFYGDGLTASTVYFQVNFTAVYGLRGRQ